MDGGGRKLSPGKLGYRDGRWYMPPSEPHQKRHSGKGKPAGASAVPGEWGVHNFPTADPRHGPWADFRQVSPDKLGEEPRLPDALQAEGESDNPGGLSGRVLAMGREKPLLPGLFQDGAVGPGCRTGMGGRATPKRLPGVCHPAQGPMDTRGGRPAEDSCGAAAIWVCRAVRNAQAVSWGNPAPVYRPRPEGSTGQGGQPRERSHMDQGGFRQAGRRYPPGRQLHADRQGNRKVRKGRPWQGLLCVLNREPGPCAGHDGRVLLGLRSARADREAGSLSLQDKDRSTEKPNRPCRRASLPHESTRV